MGSGMVDVMRIKSAFFQLFVVLAPVAVFAGDGSEVIDIGSRRELFVDTFLIESLDGAHRRLHHPIPQNIATVNDAPWEGAFTMATSTACTTGDPRWESPRES